MYDVRCITEGEKLNKCCARNHTTLFISLRGLAQEYLFCSYQYLQSLRKFTQKCKVKFFIRSLTYQNNTDYAAFRKTLNDFANVIYVCIFREAKSASCVEIKRKK